MSLDTSTRRNRKKAIAIRKAYLSWFNAEGISKDEGMEMAESFANLKTADERQMYLLNWIPIYDELEHTNFYKSHIEMLFREGFFDRYPTLNPNKK